LVDRATYQGLHHRRSRHAVPDQGFARYEMRRMPWSCRWSRRRALISSRRVRRLDHVSAPVRSSCTGIGHLRLFGPG